MRVTIEVGDGQELCYLLDREIETKRASRDVLAAMPPEQKAACGSYSYGESVKWCEKISPCTPRFARASSRRCTTAGVRSQRAEKVFD